MTIIILSLPLTSSFAIHIIPRLIPVFARIAMLVLWATLGTTVSGHVQLAVHYASTARSAVACVTAAAVQLRARRSAPPLVLVSAVLRLVVRRERASASARTPSN